MKWKVAGARIPVTRDLRQNRDSIVRAMEEAARQQADISCSPPKAP